MTDVIEKMVSAALPDAKYPHHYKRHMERAASVLIEDMREWGGTTTIYDEKTWRQHVDEYAKSRGIE